MLLELGYVLEMQCSSKGIAVGRKVCDTQCLKVPNAHDSSRQMNIDYPIFQALAYWTKALNGYLPIIPAT